jgi:photosystem II PsbU protein
MKFDRLRLGGIAPMKRLVGVLMALGVLLGCMGWLGQPQPAMALNWNSVNFSTAPLLAVEPRNRADDKLAEIGYKIDLNNTNVRAFMDYPGLYPTLARKIIQNAPYQKVDDILDIPGLSNRQIDILQASLDKFTVSAPEDTFVEGGDRFNNGIYR